MRGLGEMPRARDILVALIFGLGLAAGGALLVLRQPARFLSFATVLIDQPQAIADSKDASIVDKLSRLRFKYGGLARTSLVAAPVATKLELPERLVLRSINSTIIQQTLLFTIEARAGRPATAQRIAQATAEQIAVYAQQEQDADQVPADRQIRLEVVIPADRGVKFTPTNSRLYTITGLGGVLGLIAGYVLMRLIAPDIARRDKLRGG